MEILEYVHMVNCSLQVSLWKYTIFSCESKICVASIFAICAQFSVTSVYIRPYLPFHLNLSFLPL